MSLKGTLHFINTHPLGAKNKKQAIQNFIRWQLGQLFLNRPSLCPFIENAVLLAEKGMTGATGNIYVGLHEFEEMAFLLHLLRAEDTFLDVGANIGSYTVLAAKVVGAESYAFEPSPQTYNHLLNNLFLNRITDRATAINKGVSEAEKELYFTDGLDTINHVVKERKGAIQIKTTSLDSFCNENNRSPFLIKIDVEGFETEVINGSKNLLVDDALQAIIMELNGSGDRYGFDEEAIHQQLLNAGFKAYLYQPFSRTLTPRKERSLHGNTIYVRDYHLCQDRLTSANKFTALGISF
jgi:FkbM family methyltransferase